VLIKNPPKNKKRRFRHLGVDRTSNIGKEKKAEGLNRERHNRGVCSWGKKGVAPFERGEGLLLIIA